MREKEKQEYILKQTNKYLFIYLHNIFYFNFSSHKQHSNYYNYFIIIANIIYIHYICINTYKYIYKHCIESLIIFSYLRICQHISISIWNISWNISWNVSWNIMYETPHQFGVNVFEVHIFEVHVLQIHVFFRNHPFNCLYR